MTMREVLSAEEVRKLEGNKEREYLDKLEKDPPKVDFALLYELHQENPELRIGELIGYLEMDSIPMTDAVKKLGVCTGYLYAWKE